MSKVIVITSGKGGVGKTTTTASIGAALARLQKKVVMIDTDIGLRNLDVVMGLEHRIMYNLVDVAEGTCRLRQALIRDRQFPQLYLIPASQTRDKNALHPEQMKKILAELKEDFDYILLDSPAGIEQGFYTAVLGADQALVVTTPEISAVRDADRVIGLLDQIGIQDVRLIVNRIRPELIRRGQTLDLKDISEILNIRILGAIPEDEMVVIATNQGISLADQKSDAAKAFQNISRRLDGQYVSMENHRFLRTARKRKRGRLLFSH